MTANINGEMIEVETQVRPLPWQKLGLTYTKTGYGRRIPTQHMARLPGTTRWRRVFVCVFGNAGTAYIEDRQNRTPAGRPAWIVLA